jgi:hypothetical protein
MTKAKLTKAKKGEGSSGTGGGSSQTADGLQYLIQQAKPGSKKTKKGDYDPGEGSSKGGGVADAGVGIDMVSIGKLVTEAISQQFGLLAPRDPMTPGEITPTSQGRTQVSQAP